MNQSAFLRPDWTPATIALMVLGFMVFWPLGLAMLAYIVFGERLKSFKKDANDAADGFFASCRGRSRGFRGFRGPGFGSGNVAFDEWREAELNRIEEERRKLDEMREEFETYVRELRRAKDREEFDRFMRERRSGNGGPVQEMPSA
ncbi:DUF2852 domain-containing protein [Mycoplana dimorpha]|uniref:Uncharacterized protein DUF2852 n=1 Tax=Mycoplana dimorpha TaxID=28320 RepID=A0A2T5BAK6_MYCDI|nr:DUF2852 domain-containing protein [Mycoplana dimorpha]PTM96030.1 uncharacterized protein DUF2852 [Mycoplana dimorpha]